MEEKKIPDSIEDINKILNPDIKKWFYSKYKEFSLPQKFGVLEIHKRQNILISAPTGATKTLTAFMSILNELVDSSQKGILENRCYCVYISPLKALNYDIEHNLKNPLSEIEKITGNKLGIRVAVRTSDTTQLEKTKMLKNPPHILITTPESLAIMLSSEKFSLHLNNVSWLIIDEIHSLAENKRGTHLSISVERLAKKSNHLTRIGLSATIAPISEVAKFLVGETDKKTRDCVIVDVSFIKDQDVKVICPSDLIDSDHDEKHNLLYEKIHELIIKHKTTLIFTNTRAATEKIVDYLKHKYPKSYTDSNIGAHHGSLSKDHRLFLENSLRDGKLKCVVSSTSLELGIDIGYIDLVILLGSAKSVARALQRIGRSGHKLHEKAKGRIIVLDRDDLIENCVLLKNGIEKKIDRIHVAKNCLDVLAQQIIGIIVENEMTIFDLYNFIIQSYSYSNLDYSEFNSIIEYLAGMYVSLEDRHIYAKISYDPITGIIRRKGKLTRVIYITNIGTIPDESFISVKVGNYTVGYIDEGFMEKLKSGDVFVLGGSTYQFKYARGMVAFVSATTNRPPTVPSWYSEMLPLSFDLAMSIGKFRRLIKDKLSNNVSRKETLNFISEYLYCDNIISEQVYDYMKEQFDFSVIPDDNTILIEEYNDEIQTKYIFHTLFGRRVNDCLSRALAFAIARSQHKDVEIGLNDNGFYVSGPSGINPKRAFEMLAEQDLDKIMNLAIEKSEILKRRFRQCATRSLMILKNYLGNKKRVGKQQMYSHLLFSEVKRISNDFPILKEARREVLEDLMDIENSKLICIRIKNKEIKIISTQTNIPSPFSFNIVVQGLSDILKIEDKVEFLKRLHTYVLAKISLNKGKKVEIVEDTISDPIDRLKFLTYNLSEVPLYIKEDIVKLIEGKDTIRLESKNYIKKKLNKFPDELVDFIKTKKL